MLKTNNGSFWRLSKGARISMWIVGIMVAVLMVVLGRESLQGAVGNNVKSLGIHEVKIQQNKEEIIEVKVTMKENQKDIKEDLKAQRELLNDIHSEIIK